LKVGLAGDGDQLDAACALRRQSAQVRLVQAPERVHSDMPDAGTCPPRQVVAVVFQQRDRDDIVQLEWEAVRELLDCLARVLAEDHDVIVAIRADELRDDLARVVVRLHLDGALETGAAIPIAPPDTSLTDARAAEAVRLSL
jgi:hypothetical protein